MLDIKLIRENPEFVESKLKKRGSSINLQEILEKDKKRRELITKSEKLKSLKNKASDEISLKKQSNQDTTKLVSSMRETTTQIKSLDKEIKEIEAEIENLLSYLPNLPDDSVPVGANEQDNQVIFQEQEKSFPFHPLPHWEIGEFLGIIDFLAASKLSGNRFALLKGDGVLLERALINFMLDLHIKNGYQPIFPPLLVNYQTMFGTGQLPKFEEELYFCPKDNLYLIPTAEVPLCNLHRDEILEEKLLPLKYVAFTPCFRREAGSYGKDVKGLIRNHQFNKVELVKITSPQNSFSDLEDLLEDAKDVLKKLGLTYRIVLLCSGDLGFSAAKTYDLEVWMPGENRWREVSSISNCTDFQARRMNLKYRNSEGKLDYVHTLNASGVAVGRIFAAILENFQTEKGTILIPEVLRPYLNNQQEISHR